MKKIAVIPARLQATRFPRKLLEDLGGRSVIEQTYLATVGTDLFDQVWVATDSPEIAEKIKHIGGEVFLSQIQHNCGSNRIAEAVENLPADIIVNVQGDEPFTDKENLQKVIDIFAKDLTKSIAVASLMERITDPDDIANPNNVKVVVNKFGEALYFSRNIIPFPRDPNTKVSYYKHIGIYAYRKEALQQFTELPPSLLEETEKLEQLRYLENGFKIRLALTDIPTIGIDTPEDLERARKRLITQK